MAVKLNSTGGGSVTLDSPSTASNYTVTLPSAAGTLATTTGTTFSNSSITAANSNTVEATSGPTSTQLAGNRNKIINGAMLVWQRGTSGFTTNNNYSADRWFLSSGGSLTTGAQASDAPTTYKYSLSVAASAYPQINQRIESSNCSDLNGQTATVSFWAKSLSGGTTLSAQLYYASAVDNFGTVTSIATVSNTITTSWAQYTAVFTSLPSGVANGIQLSVFVNSGSAAAFEITGVQLEKGATATPFENRLYGTELALCQRYYQKYAQPPLRGVVDSSNNAGRMAMVLPVVMRATPTSVVGALPIFDGTNTTTVSVVAADYSNSSVTEYAFTCAISLTNVGRGCVVYQSGSTSLTLSAEL